MEDATILNIDFQPACEEDAAFFNALFLEHIKDRFIGLDPVQFELIADMQYRAKVQGYKQSWPSAENYLVVQNNQKIGQLILARFDSHLLIVDILISKALRGQGIGEHLLDLIEQDCRKWGRKICLSVASDNPAISLYVRKGFNVSSRSDSQIEMVKILN